MKRSDFLVMVHTVFPDSVITEDSRGQLIIETGWQTDPLDSDNVTFMDTDEDIATVLYNDAAYSDSNEDWGNEVLRNREHDYGRNL